MRPRLDVDLRHDPVELHPRDEPDEPVAGAREHIARVAAAPRRARRRARRARRPGSRPARRRSSAARRLIDPPAHGVVAHAEQPGGLGDLVARHDCDDITADADESWRIASACVAGATCFGDPSAIAPASGLRRTEPAPVAAFRRTREAVASAGTGSDADSPTPQAARPVVAWVHALSPARGARRRARRGRARAHRAPREPRRFRRARAAPPRRRARRRRRRRRARLPGRAGARGGGRRHPDRHRRRRGRGIQSAAPGDAPRAGCRRAQGRLRGAGRRRPVAARPWCARCGRGSPPTTPASCSPARTSSIDGTDTFETREAVASACEDLGVPLVWGVVQEFHAQVTVFWSAPPAGAPRRAAGRSVPARAASARCRPARRSACSASLCLQVGAILATETVKLITGIGEPLLGRVLVIDALRGRTDEVPLRPQRRTARSRRRRTSPPIAHVDAGRGARRPVTPARRCSTCASRTRPRTGVIPGAVHDPARRACSPTPRAPEPARSSWSARSARARCARRRALQAAGIEASVLTGGMDAWDAASRPRVSA